MTTISEAMANETNDNVTKEDRITDLVKSLMELDASILPFREQKKELMKEYVENGWITKDEKKAISKAYSIWKSKDDIDEIHKFVEAIGVLNGEGE